METAREKNLTISNLQSNDWRSWSNRRFKRLFDVLVSVLGLLLLSPVFGPPSSVSRLSSSCVNVLQATTVRLSLRRTMSASLRLANGCATPSSTNCRSGLYDRIITEGEGEARPERRRRREDL